MADKPRQFRGADSFEAEKKAREAIGATLESCGYDVIDDTWQPPRSQKSQLITARAPDGAIVKMIVKTCWRWKDSTARKFSATQLTARMKIGWRETLENIVHRAQRRATHFLIVQADEDQIVLAALIPVGALSEIWHRQREVSQGLADAGKLGRIRKNHAENGKSPTLYLRDERGPGREGIGAVVWSWPGVVNILAGEPRSRLTVVNDTFDDLPGLDPGRDAGTRFKIARSGFRRDDAVRRQVLLRSGGCCERAGCGERRAYPGFLDVHHVMGIENSDRVWTCVALCPNCHREAHFAPEREEINEMLRIYAQSFGGD